MLLLQKEFCSFNEKREQLSLQMNTVRGKMDTFFHADHGPLS